MIGSRRGSPLGEPPSVALELLRSHRSWQQHVLIHPCKNTETTVSPPKKGKKFKRTIIGLKRYHKGELVVVLVTSIDTAVILKGGTIRDQEKGRLKKKQYDGVKLHP